MYSLFESIAALDAFTVVSFFTALSGGVMLAGAHCCGSDDCDGEHGEEDDSAYAELEAKIEEYREKLESGDTEVQRDLADATLALAVQLQQDDYLEESIAMYEDAHRNFEELSEKNKDDQDLVRIIGLINLSKAVALNDSDLKEDALESYEAAMEVLQPMAEAGDGEAKYDIAGIKLNLGTIRHELGDLEVAQKLLDESFNEFRALEKISELDTRFYMGKASVALGNLGRDMEEPIEKIVDCYNRAMRLYVELIDAGDTHHELDLANVLIDKCMARFDAGEGEDVLQDLQRGIEILENLVNSGVEEATFDLFAAMSAYAFTLLQLEKFNDAKGVLDEILEKFSSFEYADDPIILNEYAAVLENRGMCLYNLEKVDEALADMGKAIEIREDFWGEDWGLEEQDLAHFAPVLVSSYCNRAMICEVTDRHDLAVADCQKASKLLEPYADEIGEDYQELLEQIRAIEKGN